MLSTLSASAPRWSAADGASVARRSASAARGGVRPLVVAAMSLCLFALFFSYEHDLEMAGSQVTEKQEEDIKDEYMEQIESGSVTRKIGVLGYAAIGMLAALAPGGRPVRVRPLALALAAMLAAWMLTSFAWSEEPGLTVRRLVAAACFLFGSIGFARFLRPSELLVIALITFAAFVLLSFALDVRAGGRPWQGDFRFGGTLHPNIQAAYCGVLCIAAYCQPMGLGRRWVTRALMAAGAMLLVLTQSRTSFLAMLAALVAVFLLRLGERTRWIAALALVCAASFGLLFYGAFDDTTRAQLTGAALLGRTQDAGSLTGRVPLWQELVGYAADRPLGGYGYDSFWTPDRIAAVMKSQQWSIQSAHNAYFETTLQLGLIGLGLAVPLVAVSINLLQRAYALTKDPGYAFGYGLLAFAVLNSFLESHFAKLKYPTIVALLVILSVALYFPGDPSEVGDSSEANNRGPAPRGTRRGAAAAHRIGRALA